MWILTIPAVLPEHFDQAVALVLQREAPKLAPLGATHAAELATECVKEMVRVWDVAQVAGRTFGAVVTGHANPDGIAPEGFPADSITIKLWRSG